MPTKRALSVFTLAIALTLTARAEAALNYRCLIDALKKIGAGVARVTDAILTPIIPPMDVPSGRGSHGDNAWGGSGWGGGGWGGFRGGRDPHWNPRVTPPGRNNDPEFVGVVAIKKKQAAQLAELERLAQRGDWMGLRHHHFDWWMFPIDEPSSWGKMWMVQAGDIADLKQDREFIRNFRKGQELLARSWGWDLKNGRPLTTRSRDQHWDNWPVRLYKAAKSAKLLGCNDIYESWKKLARQRIDAGDHFSYAGFDLTWLFN